ARAPQSAVSTRVRDSAPHRDEVGSCDGRAGHLLMSETHLTEAANALRYVSCYEYCEGSAVPYTDDREEFHGAMRRLRRLLLGDGLGSPGKLKGEDARAQATRDLRRMREAFDAVVARSDEGRTEKAEVEA